MEVWTCKRIFFLLFSISIFLFFPMRGTHEIVESAEQLSAKELAELEAAKEKAWEETLKEQFPGPEGERRLKKEIEEEIMHPPKEPVRGYVFPIEEQKEKVPREKFKKQIEEEILHPSKEPVRGYEFPIDEKIRIKKLTPEETAKRLAEHKEQLVEEVLEKEFPGAEKFRLKKQVEAIKAPKEDKKPRGLGIPLIKEERVKVPMFTKVIKGNLFAFELAGYLRLDSFYDSRQTRDAWLGMDLFSPQDRFLDPGNRDINDKDQFSMTSKGQVELRINGPEVWGGESYVFFKTDSAGRFGNFTLFRYKNGYFRISWEKSSLLAGLYYHPISIDYLYPETVGESEGEPIDPFAYATMFKVTHRIDPCEFIFAVTKDFWHQSSRDSVSPGLFLQTNVYYGDHLFCAGVDFLSFVPRLYTDTTEADAALYPYDVGPYKETQSINSFMPFIAMRLRKNDIVWKSRLIYAGESAEIYSVMGGYGVCKRNQATDERRYTKIASLNFWTEVYRRTEKMEIGIFLGFGQNLGSSHELQKDKHGNYLAYGYLTGVDTLFRMQPRIRFYRGPAMLCFELDFIRATYGDLNKCGKVITNKCRAVSNIRLLSSVKYEF